MELKKEDPKMGTESEDDGDFVLENVNLSGFNENNEIQDGEDPNTLQ